MYGVCTKMLLEKGCNPDLEILVTSIYIFSSPDSVNGNIKYTAKVMHGYQNWANISNNKHRKSSLLRFFAHLDSIYTDCGKIKR